MNRVTYALLSTLILFDCNASKRSIALKDTLHTHVPKVFNYDTVSGNFFYESFIESYISVDAVLKSGGFIKAETINDECYKSGYYVGQANAYVKYLQQKGISIRYDESSIAAFYDSLFQKNVRAETDNNSTYINPYCGSYYKKFRLEVEVLFIDSISQRTPLFMNCKDFEEYVRSNKGKNYKTDSIPTYIITRIFSWREM